MKIGYRFALLTILIACAGCQQARVTAVETVEVTPSEEVSDISTREAIEETEPLPAVYSLSEQVYQALDGAFGVRLPSGWNCSEPADLQVDCQSPDGIASLSFTVTNTGYELTDEMLTVFAHAERVKAYADVKEYQEVSQSDKLGLISSVGAWRFGDTYFDGSDHFLRGSGAVAHVHIETIQDVENNLDGLLTEFLESISFNPPVIREHPLYAKRFTYIAPDTFFELDIPTAWGKFTDVATVENTVMEGFLSPDQRASIQVAIYRHGATITQTLKAERTLEIMRAYYGHDLRVSHDKALADGRERLAWRAERKGINGISYFDSFGGSLYVLSFIWEEPMADIYAPILEEIQESFTRR